MASVWKRKTEGKSAVYRVSYKDEHGKRRTAVGFRDRGQTVRLGVALEERCRAIAAGLISPDHDRLVDARKRPVDDHVTEYLERCRLDHQAVRHIANKRAQLRAIIAGVGARAIQDIDADRLEKFLDRLQAEGYAARTVNQHLTTARAFIRWCIRNGRLSADPLVRLRKLDESMDRRRVRRAFTPAELEKLLNAVPAYRRIVYLVAAYTGMRRGSLKKLRWQDVDFQGGTILVLGKKKAGYHIPLHPLLAPVLLAHRPADAKLSDAVFTESVPRPSTVKGDLNAAGVILKDEAGRVADLHAFRTTLATNHVRAGTHPLELMKLMGHSRIETTQKHYTDLRMEDMRRAAATVDPISAAPARRPGVPGGRAVASRGKEAYNRHRRLVRHEGAGLAADVRSQATAGNSQQTSGVLTGA